MYVLEVISGPLDGKTWTFDKEITIGRDEAVATACITIDRYISRKHAKLSIGEGRLRLTDLQSRNGTQVDGELVIDETVLELGKPFTVGRTILRVTKGNGA